jgi:hypothetical protein
MAGHSRVVLAGMTRSIKKPEHHFNRDTASEILRRRLLALHQFLNHLLHLIAAPAAHFRT